VIHNPRASGTGSLDAVCTALRQLRRVRTLDVRTGENLGEVAVAAIQDGGNLLVVAGGDGTIHAVLNGLMLASPHLRRVPVAIVPLGTGNDLSRTLAIPAEPAAIAELLRRGRLRMLDVIQIDTPGRPTRYAANVITGGFSGKVSSGVTPAQKQFWGPLAYLRGAIGPITARPSYRITLTFDDQPRHELDALNLVIANGRTAAGGFPVAPQANPEDGLLDVVIVPAAPWTDLSIIAARLMEGDYTADEAVLHRRARRIQLHSEPPMPLSIDGELDEGSQFCFTVRPRAWRVYVGRDYHRNPRGGSRLSFGVTTVLRRGFGLIAMGLVLLLRLPRDYLAGLILCWLGVIGFLLMVRGLGADSWTILDQQVRQMLQNNSSHGLDAVAVFFHGLGHWLSTNLLAGGMASYWLIRRHYRDALMMLVLCLGSDGIEVVLKELFQIERPQPVGWFPRPESYGFPSGHALRGVALSVYLAGLLGRSRFSGRVRVLGILGLIAVAGGLGWSRLYLGVHTLMDVLAGTIAGATWATWCLLVRNWLRRRRRARLNMPVSEGKAGVSSSGEPSPAEPASNVSSVPLRHDP